MSLADDPVETRTVGAQLAETSSLDSDARFDEATERILRGELPIPVRARWQPLRAGLMNLFLFEDERFPFADGRLLLRGSNGAGKSRVLAMTLPLLLDGSLKATRVEPDRDSNRQVAWNLLMDDQNSATGYSWLEFGRIDEAGDQFLTIGMGMRAVRDQPIKAWFFITEARVDENLSLKSADGVPLTQRQLADVLADSGQVMETATDYRRAIDERLFRLGDRYDPLIDLLLRLRQPKLAKNLDIDELEATLRQALPPLTESLLDDAAEAFRDLDHYRRALAADQQTLSDIHRFLKPYQDHVRRGLLRSIKQLTGANSRFETAQRILRQLTEQQEQDQRRLEQLTQRKHTLSIETESTRAAISELEKSPEMRDALRLDELRGQAAEQERKAADYGVELDEALHQERETKQTLQTCTAEVAAKYDVVLAASDECRRIAAPESLQNRHQEWMAPVLTDRRTNDFAEAKQQLLLVVRRFASAAEHLVELAKQIAEAQAKLAAARVETERCDAASRERREHLQELQTQLEETRETLWQSLLKWYELATLIRDHLPAIAFWSDQWHEWPGDSHESDPSLRHLQKARKETMSRLTSERTRLTGGREGLSEKLQELDARQQRLAAGEPIEPTPPSHRDRAVRLQRAGAPFWKLIEFQPAVPEAERGHWEAALQDAGILDAWLSPEGQWLTTDDVQLIEAGLPEPVHAQQLARVLRVVADDLGDVKRDLLERLLRVIGVGVDSARTWVDHDGRWQNGPLQGRWTKDQPQFIGEEARRHWRQLCLEALQHEREAILRQQQAIHTRIEQLGEEEKQLEALLATFPGNRALLELTFKLSAAQRDTDQAAAQLSQAQLAEAKCRDWVVAISSERDADAADAGLSGWATRATELGERLSNYRERLETLEARTEALATSMRQADQARATIQRTLSAREQAQTRFQSLQIELGRSRETVRVLEESVGQGAVEMMARLDAQRESLRDKVSTTEETSKQIGDVDRSLAVIDNKLQQGQADADNHDAVRREMSDWFASLHTQGLLELVTSDIEIPELPWSMTQAIKLARRADAVLAEAAIDDDAWHASQNRVHQAQTELQQTLLSQDGMAVEVDHLRDGLQLITLAVGGERFTPAVAVARLQTEIGNRQRILDEKEQETLEKYLLGEVAEGLRSGMRMASELVELMTHEVSTRPLKTGMQMRFKWKRNDEGPPGLAEACEVLATSSATWSPEEREQIKQFLQRSIRLQRDTEQTGSWHDHLRDALDYRLWHRISIERRAGPDAPWKRLSKRTYGSGSGGEKAILLTLPQLAAAAAYYQTADARAPRFILLDEAFAGVSADGRESCLELIAAFKLDVVMTSEIEWGCYAGVRQLAICQLDRFADIGAVVNRVYVWNGSEKRQATSAAAIAEAARQPLFKEM